MANTLKFKTTINCGGCVARVTPLLDKLPGIEEWQVDTESPQKILTVRANDTVVTEIMETVKKAGFNIESL